MEHKPDKFEKKAVTVTTVVISIALGIFLIVITTIRFADASEPLFSYSNILRGVLALLGFAAVGTAVGALLYKVKKESDK